MKRKDQRHFTASVNDGLGLGTVWIVDGYDRMISDDLSDFFRAVGVHTREEAEEFVKALL